MPLKTKSIHSNIITIALSIFLVAAFIIAYFPAWKSLFHCWNTSEEYSHGFLIVPLCCYFLWRKQKKLSGTPPNPSIWGLVIVIFSLLLYIFSHYAEITTIKSFSIISSLMGLVIYLFGFQMFKECMFPLFFLFLMIPVPSQIYSQLTIPLQLFVSETSAFLANHLGIPIFREGNIIHLPNQKLQVVQACSGLRSLFCLLTMGAVLGYLTLKSNLLRTLLFFAGIPTAIIVNIFRVLLIIFGFYYFKYDLTADTAHTIFSVIIFIFALIVIAGIRGVLSIWDRNTAQKS